MSLELLFRSNMPTRDTIIEDHVYLKTPKLFCLASYTIRIFIGGGSLSIPNILLYQLQLWEVSNCKPPPACVSSVYLITFFMLVHVVFISISSFFDEMEELQLGLSSSIGYSCVSLMEYDVVYCFVQIWWGLGQNNCKLELYILAVLL